MTDGIGTGGASQAAPPRPLADRVVVFGEMLFDHFDDGSRVLGGAPFNVAWHLCGFGRDPVPISAVGEDEEGREILGRLRSWGLSAVGIGRIPDRSTGRVVVEIVDGEPAYSIPPDQAWDLVPEPELGEGRPELVYHGTLALRTPRALASWLDLRSRIRAPVFVDLNLRDPWWDDALVRRCTEGVAWVKASAQELGRVTGLPSGTSDACEAAARSLIASHGVGRVVVTRGERGSLLVRPDGETVPAAAAEGGEVVDTVGAGDAFSAVVCHGILDGWDERTMLERASAFALDICTVRGATTGDLSLYERHLRRWAETPAPSGGRRGLRVLMLSIHGLVRGDDIELGRDADTGGQVSYAVDQARALARHPEIEAVTLVTRRVEDRKVAESYGAASEDLGGGAAIVRLPFGPRRYLRKESLWPHVDSLVDQLARWVRAQPTPPDVIHGHYADAGYVGSQLSKLLGVPFVFTGHSLGRVKRARLMADGKPEEVIEERYRISHRIEAEEQALEAADVVIASTTQEVREQFEGYDHYAPERMRVIPPGVDLTRFSPPGDHWKSPAIADELERFLVEPDKPLILTIARPDERKNFAGLIEAYAGTPGLREAANLAIVAGGRDDIREMEAAPRRVLSEILMLIDAHDLYGSVAYPKRHRPADVPELYRYAATLKGVFVNPALSEPFGLTLLEAAATGLPVVATDDGGPRDILAECGHGVLADVLDREALGATILDALSDEERWGRWSKNGVSRVHEGFSWASHARAYVEAVRPAVGGAAPTHEIGDPSHMREIDRMVVSDIDRTLTGDEAGLAELMACIREAAPKVGFGVATSRDLDSTLQLLRSLDVELPDVLVTASGAEMRYGRALIRDRSWSLRIRHRWDPTAVRAALDGVDGLRPDEVYTAPFRLRYAVDAEVAPRAAELRRRLRRAGVQATVVFDRDSGLDVVPVRASPGLALRFFGHKWNLEPSRILVAGDSGNDRDMLEGDTLGVVVGNHTPELEELRDHPRIFFARRANAWGILDGIEHYDFFREIRTGDDDRNDR